MQVNTPHVTGCLQEGSLGKGSPAGRMGTLGEHKSAGQEPSLAKTCSSPLFPCQRGGHQEFTVETWLGEKGRNLGRDLHVKGPSEPYCCSASPILHVSSSGLCPALLGLLPHCPSPCKASVPWPLNGYLWHHHGSAQVTFGAMFPTLSWTDMADFGQSTATDKSAFLPGLLQRLRSAMSKQIGGAGEGFLSQAISRISPTLILPHWEAWGH